MRRLLFIYIRLWRAREREREEETRGRRQAEFYLWPIRLINNARRALSSLYASRPRSIITRLLLAPPRGRAELSVYTANGVEKLIRSLTNRIRNSATRARRVPRERDVKG